MKVSVGKRGDSRGTTLNKGGLAAAFAWEQARMSHPLTNDKNLFAPAQMSWQKARPHDPQGP